MANGSRARNRLDHAGLCAAARRFAQKQFRHDEPKLLGITDGKAVGTYLEAKFLASLARRYLLQTGNAAKGIDLPKLGVDIKSTSIRQPQSSSPFRSAKQKVFGLGYSLLVFVYEKRDNKAKGVARLDIKHVVYIEKERTADYQTTRGLLQILGNKGNEDDLVAFLQDRMLPADEIELRGIAEKLLDHKPVQGFLTISNALQWRLQYQHVIGSAGSVDGVIRVF